MEDNLMNYSKKGVRQIKGVLLLLICFLVSSSAVWAQSANITLNAKNKPLKEVLSEIEKQSNYSFIYSSSTIDVAKPVTAVFTNASVTTVLDKICAEVGITYSVNNNQIVLSPINKKATPATRATTSSKNNESLDGKIVKGHVVDEKGEAIPGANVWIKGSTIGVATDIDGNYTLTLKGNPQILVASFIGYTPVEMSLNATGEKYNFTLKPESQMIEEVIITGYQTISKERATGSFAIVSPKDMEGKLQTNIMDRMEGMVAGLSSNRGKIEIRGVSTMKGNKDPLYVVDGIPYEGSLDAINPGDIVNITVLKDATAASIYGARSGNGVIVITTRSGSSGPTKVSYNGSLRMQGLPDRDYSNKMSSRELVDYQQMIFDSYPNISRSKASVFQNDVQVLLLDHKDGRISATELNQKLEVYKNRDRYDQVIEEFLRKRSLTHQHNLSFGGGSDFYKYNLSVNYMGDAPYEKEQVKERVGFNLKNTFNFFKWMRFDAGIIGSNVSSDYDNGVLGMSLLDSGMSSYYMLRDENGNPSQMYGSKSQTEIDRLNNLGLQDETYTPVTEMGSKHYTAKSNYLNLNLGLNLKLTENLNVDVRYQTETTKGYTKQYDSKNALSVKTMINDATKMKDGVAQLYIPLGGQITQTNTDNQSYTLRAQVNYNNIFQDKHDVQVLVGTERRKVVTSSHGFYRVGYDDDNLSFSYINELELNQQIKGTEATGGTFNFTNKTPKFIQKDNRFVSFYANGSYTYDRRMTVTGSIRIDQSNLFGTDPKYQYKPLWSVGAHYVALENMDWIDRLVVRATYGINGNISKDNGPFLIAATDRNNYYTNESAFYIKTPPNPTLRWEKTKVVNVGVDFNLLSNRLNGSVEFYNKNSSDLLGDFASDPTLGWSALMMNFASMYNRGVEVALQSENINTGSFRWTSNFLFGYNKNEVTKVESGDESALSYYNGLNTRKGYARNSLFSVRYAGLDEKGMPTAYKKDGTIVKSSKLLDKEDLVYSGTYDPRFNASLTNTFSYKGFDLSLMFIYSGGHVMRDVAAGQMIYQHPSYQTSNRDKDIMNYWKKPGDEKNPNTNPAFLFGTSSNYNVNDLWGAADKHVEKGDFIKLRDVTLGYTLPSGLLKKYMIQGVRVNVQVQNLWWWAANDSDLDPEVWSGSSLTPSRGTLYPASVTFGLSLNF